MVAYVELWFSDAFIDVCYLQVRQSVAGANTRLGDRATLSFDAIELEQKRIDR